MSAFLPRSELHDYEWDNQRKDWKRPDIDRAVLRELSERSTANGLIRIGYFLVLLSVSAVATMLLYRESPFLSIIPLYLYYFFYGFWVAIAHELQHKTVFGKSADRFSETIYFLVQTIVWNSPRYARISHRLHHRYTMIRGIDPETDWPQVITTKTLRRMLLERILRILVIGAVYRFVVDVSIQVRRVLGIRDRMMREHCTPRDIAVIRLESLAILAIHGAIMTLAIMYRRWELIAFITLAWQLGSPIEELWHLTKHIGRPYDVNDHRLNTRSIRVSRFIKSFFWGLDDHVEHHLFPIVPSRNLPRLHEILADRLPEPGNILGCWTEMFSITREKDRNPQTEYLAIDD